MPGNVFYLPRIVAIDNGAVVPGAKLIFTATGTSTPQAVYTDIDLSVAHDDPVVAGADGIFAPIYLDPSFGDYRVSMTDSDDNVLDGWPVDDIPASSSGRTITLTDANPYIDFIESDAAANNGVWRLGVNSEQMLLQLGNDAKDTFVDIAVIDRTANTVDIINLKTAALQQNGVAVADPIISEAVAFASWNASTTYADIITAVSLLADTDYAFDCSFILNTDATPDFKIRFHTADTLTLDANTQAILTVIDESAGTVQGVNLQGALDTDFTIDGSTGDQFCTIRGTIRVDAAGSFSIQGAQNTSDASATEITQGGLFSIWPIRSA